MAAGGGPKTASGIVNLARREGVDGLRAALGCTRRQAEQVLMLARRALARGEVLNEADIPRDTVHAAEVSRAGVPAAEPARVDLQAEAESWARRIRALPTSDRARAEMDLIARTAVLERNIRAGYLEWRGELAHLKRVRELVAGVVTS